MVVFVAVAGVIGVAAESVDIVAEADAGGSNRPIRAEVNRFWCAGVEDGVVSADVELFMICNAGIICNAGVCSDNFIEVLVDALFFAVFWANVKEFSSCDRPSWITAEADFMCWRDENMDGVGVVNVFLDEECPYCASALEVEVFVRCIIDNECIVGVSCSRGAAKLCVNRSD